MINKVRKVIMDLVISVIEAKIKLQILNTMIKRMRKVMMKMDLVILEKNKQKLSLKKRKR